MNSEKLETAKNWGLFVLFLLVSPFVALYTYSIVFIDYIQSFRGKQ